jgi:hypothetical protein
MEIFAAAFPGGRKPSPDPDPAAREHCVVQQSISVQVEISDESR